MMTSRFPLAADAALAALPPIMAKWFLAYRGLPTAAQRLAWPVLAQKESLLLAAPTGTGKTLAAFVPIIADIQAQPRQSDVHALYVAPLKALVQDIAFNLLEALQSLSSLDSGCGSIRVLARTGDSSTKLRQEIRSDPPAILLTTPESLAIMLSDPAQASFFLGLRWVVVDEVHALAESKRGCDLAVSLERIQWNARQPIVRVGLSATCSPLSEAARLLVGPERPCSLGEVLTSPQLRLTIEPLPIEASFTGPLVERLGSEIEECQTTLIFANQRSMAERLGWHLRRAYPEWDDAIAVHHSAVSAAKRKAIERKLKLGQLRAVVCSSTLELGVDMGHVENVVLIHPPGAVSRYLQRLGRSGHGPARLRRGLILTSGPAELLEAAVTAASGRDRQLEPVRIPSVPLDVLCQQLVGMACQRPWTPLEALSCIRAAYPFHELSERDLKDCLDYLSGRRQDGSDWLPARLCWFGEEFSILDERTARLARRNFGTIDALPQRPVRLADGGTLGEVQEGFADKLLPGDRFLLDGKCLELRGGDAGKLVVQEVVGVPLMPRWLGEGPSMSEGLANLAYTIRDLAVDALRGSPDACLAVLQQELGLSGHNANLVLEYLQSQEAVSVVPDQPGWLVEIVAREDQVDWYAHTPLPRSANEVLARVALMRLGRDYGLSGKSQVADLGFCLELWPSMDFGADQMRRLFSPAGWEDDLRHSLAGSETLREQLRRVALTSLMILREPRGGQRKVGGRQWANHRLFDRLTRLDPEFVLLRQAWREVEELFCIEAANGWIEGLPGRTLVVRKLASPSPFAMAWTKAKFGPEETIQTPAESLRKLQAELLGARSHHG